MGQQVQIEFEVVTPDGAGPVFISGSTAPLGHWSPCACALVRRGDHWHTQVALPVGETVAFKLTQGSWQVEAITTADPAGGNLRLRVDAPQRVRIEVQRWRRQAGRPHGPTLGQLQSLGRFAAPGLAAREVIVWLPTAYAQQPQQRFPVLYMHDGQNIVDPDTAFAQVDWRVDETVEALVQAGRVRQPPIVVGIYNTAARLREYSVGALGQAYLRFLVQQVKPTIDARYRTLPGRQHTATMGSSMGGLIAFLAAWQHPQVFGQVACLSPLFWGKRTVAVNAWKMVEQRPQQPLQAAIYLDNGTVGLERQLMPGCVQMLRVLQQRGYRPGPRLHWFRDEGAEHNEAAWAQRLWRPLSFFYACGDTTSPGASC